MIPAAPPTTIPDVARYSNDAKRDWFNRQPHERREQFTKMARAEAKRIEQHDATDTDIERYAIVLAVRHYTAWRSKKMTDAASLRPGLSQSPDARPAPRAGKADVPKTPEEATKALLAVLERKLLTDDASAALDAEELRKGIGIEEEVEISQALRPHLRARLGTTAAPNGKGSITIASTRTKPSVNLPVTVARDYLRHLIAGGNTHAYDFIRQNAAPAEERPHWSEIAERP